VPRFTNTSARDERAALAQMLEGPRLAVVTTEFAIFERDDREVNGRIVARPREVAREQDLTFVVDLRKRTRRNGWEIMTSTGRELFEQTVRAAQPFGTPAADIVRIPIVFTCTEDAIEQIRDDETETIYWSGGWRSGKTFRMDQWWLRGWAKFGGQGRLFWLLGPERQHAFRMMEKIFLGREGTPSVAPSYRDELGQRRSMLVPVMPASFKVPDPSFRFIDDAKGQLFHTKTVSGLEGEDVQRIAMDEATRMTSADAYKICRGRVTQCGGQVGLASVPDDSGAWVFDEIVAPVEAGTAEHKAVHFVSSFSNAWLAEENAKRLADGETDPIVRAQKVEGKWTRAGMYAYSDAFLAGKNVLDILSHEPEAWGFEHDITAQVAREITGKPSAYLGALDFNERPQTALMGRIFTDNPRDWRTWHLVWLFEQVLHRADARQAAAKLRDEGGGLYRGASLVPDCNGFFDGHRYGGVASKSSDVFEFVSRGFFCEPAVRTPAKRTARGFAGGNEPKNPPIPDSRRLVRQLLAEQRMLVSAGGCPMLANALPKVPFGAKQSRYANTALDRQILNLDDCARYLSWKVFGARMVPQATTTAYRVRGAPRLQGARRA
jgi:hypothetical protein